MSVTQPQNVQYLGCPGLRPPQGHPGRAAWELQPDADSRNEYSGRGVLSQTPGVQHCVHPGSGRGSARRGGIGREGAAGGTECQINTLPRSERGEL